VARPFLRVAWRDGDAADWNHHHRLVVVVVVFIVIIAGAAMAAQINDFLLILETNAVHG
jgi:hypothetical protein